MVAVDPITDIRLYDPTAGDIYPVAYVLLITTAIGEDATCRVTPSKCVKVCYTRGSVDRALCDIQVVTVDTYRRQKTGIYDGYELAQGSTIEGPGSNLVFIVKRCAPDNFDSSISDLCIVDYSGGEPVPYSYTTISSWKDLRLFRRGEKLLCVKYMGQATGNSEPDGPMDDTNALPSFGGESMVNHPPSYSPKASRDAEGVHSSYFVARALEAMGDSNWSLAMMYFSASIEQDPTNPFLMLQRAIISNAFRKKINVQQTDLTVAFNLQPDWVPLCYYRGCMHERIANSNKGGGSSDMHTAVVCYKKCLSLDLENEYEETQKARNKLDLLQPKVLDMYLKRAQRASGTLLHQTSVTELTFALDHCSLNSQRANVLKMRGDSYCNLEDFEKALVDYTRCFDLSGLTEVRTRKAHVLQKLGREEEANEELRIVSMKSEKSVAKSNLLQTWSLYFGLRNRFTGWSNTGTSRISNQPPQVFSAQISIAP